MPKEMQGLLSVLFIPFLIILILLATFIDVTIPLNQLRIAIFSEVYWINGEVILVYVYIKLEKRRWKRTKKKEAI